MAVGAVLTGAERRGRRLRRDGLAAVPRLRGDGAGLRHGRRRRRRLDHVQVVHPPPGQGHLAVLDRRVVGRRHARPPGHLADRRGRPAPRRAGARRPRGDRRPARAVAGGGRRPGGDRLAGRRSGRPRRRPAASTARGCSWTRSTAPGPASEARRTTSFWALLIGFAHGPGHPDGGAHPPAVVPPGARQAGLALGRRPRRHRHHDRLDRRPPGRRAVLRRQGRQAGDDRGAVRRPGGGGPALHRRQRHGGHLRRRAAVRLHHRQRLHDDVAAHGGDLRHPVVRHRVRRGSLAGQLGSGVGLVFIGWAHDVTDSYTVPFVVLAAVNLVAAMVITFARPVPPIVVERRGPDVGRRNDQDPDQNDISSRVL